MTSTDAPQLYTTLAGEWGWVCPTCRAESRYAYGERQTADRLRRRHLRYCDADPRKLRGRFR